MTKAAAIFNNKGSSREPTRACLEDAHPWPRVKAFEFRYIELH